MPVLNCNSHLPDWQNQRQFLGLETNNVFPYGCFQKWCYPQIIQFNMVFHYKPSILRGFHPIFGNTHIHQCLARYFRSKTQQYQLGTCEFRPPMWRWEYFTASTILTVKRRQCMTMWGCKIACQQHMFNIFYTFNGYQIREHAYSSW